MSIIVISTVVVNTAGTLKISFPSGICGVVVAQSPLMNVVKSVQGFVIAINNARNNERKNPVRWKKITK